MDQWIPRSNRPNSVFFHSLQAHQEGIYHSTAIPRMQVYGSFHKHSDIYDPYFGDPKIGNPNCPETLRKRKSWFSLEGQRALAGKLIMGIIY